MEFFEDFAFCPIMLPDWQTLFRIYGQDECNSV
jgi:hypothetical protein